MAALAPLVLILAAVTITACQPGVDCDTDVYHPGANLSGTDQTGKQLLQCDLSGIDFSGADFSGSNLGNADLTDANLTDAVFDGTNLQNARISSATIEGSVFGNAANILVFSGGLAGTPASLPVNWSLHGGYLVGPGVNLVGTDLSGIDLRQANLTTAFLMGATLDGTDLNYTTLTGSNLDGTDLGGSILDHVSSGGIVGTPASLPPGWSLVDGTLIGPNEPDATGQTVCEAGQGCTSDPVVAGTTKVVGSFGPGGTGVNLVVNIDPTDGPPFECPSYPAGPDKPVVEFFFTGGDASDRTGTITTTYGDAPSEPNLDDYQVCWAAPYPFVSKVGSVLSVATVQGTKPGTGAPLFVGLLPDCDLGSYTLGPPCVADRSYDYYEGVSVTVSTTGADPWRY